MIYLFHFFTKK